MNKRVDKAFEEAMSNITLRDFLSSFVNAVAPHGGSNLRFIMSDSLDNEMELVYDNFEIYPSGDVVINFHPYIEEYPQINDKKRR